MFADLCYSNAEQNDKNQLGSEQDNNLTLSPELMKISSERNEEMNEILHKLSYFK